MVCSVESVYEQLPHFGTIHSYDKDIDICAYPFSSLNSNEEYHVPGIYCIVNHIANKIYIGMSKDIKNRLITHHRELKPDGMIHHNPDMQKDSKFFGYDSFSFGVLETFDEFNREFLMIREEEWIRYYENQSTNCIYNSNRITPSKLEEYCHKLNIQDTDLLEEVKIDHANKYEYPLEKEERKSISKSVRISETDNGRIIESGMTIREIIKLGLDCIDGGIDKNFDMSNDYFKFKEMEIKLEASEKLLKLYKLKLQKLGCE